MSSASAHNALRSLNSSAQVKLLGSMQTPPVPSLITTSNSSQKLSNGTPFHQLSSSNMPPLRPKLPSGSLSSHEIITIGDSPVTKNPPPLLPTPSTGLTGLPSHAPRRSLPLVLTHKQNSHYSYYCCVSHHFIAINDNPRLGHTINNCCLDYKLHGHFRHIINYSFHSQIFSLPVQ